MNRGRTLTVIALLASVYFVAGKLGLMLAFVNDSATAVWPPTGIALAAFLVLGYRVWPGIFFGAFLVNVTTAGSVATSVGIAAGNTLEGVVGAYLLSRFANGRNAFDRPQDIFKFAVLAGMGSTMVSATIGVTGLCLGGYATWVGYGSVWMTWWLGDAMGNLIVAPLLVLWSADPRVRWNRYQALEAALVLFLLFLIGQAVFGGLLAGAIGDHPIEFLCVPMLVWVAFRFGPRETATAAFVLSGIALWGTLNGSGPFVRGLQNESLLLLQSFMGVIALMVLALAAAVAERRRAEEVLGEKVLELGRSNADLERFAYVASHDLQEPLRMVSSYTELLARRYKGKLDADAEEFIHFTLDGARRMRQLIEDLLSYSRMGSKGRRLAPTDFENALARALENLRHSIEESGGVVTHDPLPRLVVDEAQVIQVFQNLVGNAIKFRGEEAPRVHVSAERNHNEWVFTVHDNGIGVDPRHSERIFIMFQRLHSREKYPGTGIGLAICKKIVEGHGGRIWVESEPGRGARFYFTFPLREAIESRVMEGRASG